jgi:phosphate-selective porin
LREDKIWLWILFLLILVRASVAGENREESPFFPDQSLKWSGYFQVRYAQPEEGVNEFRIRRARLSLRGEIHKNIRYKLQVDAVKSPVLLDAEVEIHFNPQLRLRFGQFKVPFSLENLTSSSALDTINRSQTVENLCPGRDIRAAGRDIGVSLNGRFSGIEYSIGIFNGSGINKADTNDRKDIAARLVFYPVSSLVLGLSHYRGGYSSEQDDPILDKNRTGLEIAFVQERLSVKGEYIFARDDETKKYGWYVQGVYEFIPENIQAVIKYDCLDTNMHIRGNRSEMMTFGLNWFFSKKTLLQVNYEYHKEEANESSKNAVLIQFQAGF